MQKIECPGCGNAWIAEILWGYPENTESLEKSLEKKEISLGGCYITDHDPKWECNNCHNRWGNAEHNNEDKTNSFDFDQGFNLDEVYD